MIVAPRAWPRCLAPLVLLASVVAAGCAGPARLQLPGEGGAPLDDPGPLARASFARCENLRTLTAEIAVSGRAGHQKIRARLLAGFAAPGAIRLEAVAPFGRPGFILAADAHAATLLLPRDGRVLTGAAPGDILAALAGIPLSPDDLRSVLAGCPGTSSPVRGGTRYGTTWTVLDFGARWHAYLRARHGEWPLSAITAPGLVAEYPETTARAGAQPSIVRLLDDPCPAGTSSCEAAEPRFDVTLRLSQVEVNVPLPADAFAVQVPADAVPITLDELRDAGPMRDTSAGTR